MSDDDDTAVIEDPTLANSKSGHIGRNVIINEVIKAQKTKEKAADAAKNTVMQVLRSEIDDQHRLLEDELKTVVIAVCLMLMKVVNLLHKFV